MSILSPCLSVCLFVCLFNQFIQLDQCVLPSTSSSLPSCLIFTPLVILACSKFPSSSSPLSTNPYLLTWMQVGGRKSAQEWDSIRRNEKKKKARQTDWLTSFTSLAILAYWKFPSSSCPLFINPFLLMWMQLRINRDGNTRREEKRKKVETDWHFLFLSALYQSIPPEWMQIRNLSGAGIEHKTGRRRGRQRRAARLFILLSALYQSIPPNVDVDQRAVRGRHSEWWMGGDRTNRDFTHWSTHPSPLYQSIPPDAGYTQSG